MKARYISIPVIAFLILAVVSCREKSQEKWAASKEDVIFADSSVDKTVGTIGDKIRYAIRIRYKNTLKVIFPDYKGDIGGLAIKDSGEKPAKVRGDYVLSERWYRLETFEPGSYIIPPAVITYIDQAGGKNEIKTPQIFVEIKSSIKEGEKAADIRDIKTPVSLKENYLFYLVVVGAFAALCAAAAFGIYYYKKMKAERLRRLPPRPAHEIAFEELERLLGMGLVEKGKMKEYYTILSDIVRRYIENRFSIKAKEQTTQEFLNEISFSNILEEDAKKVIAGFLVACDMVKFAKYGPGQTEAREAYDLAREFIEKTMLRIVQNSKSEILNSKQTLNLKSKIQNL